MTRLISELKLTRASPTSLAGLQACLNPKSDGDKSLLRADMLLVGPCDIY
jgi:hypothetical protein